MLFLYIGETMANHLSTCYLEDLERWAVAVENDVDDGRPVPA